MSDILKGRIKRLLVPFFLVGLLYMLPLKYYALYYAGEEFFSVAKTFLLGTECGHLWFLPALFWCTILFALLYKVLKKMNADDPYILLGIAGSVSLCYRWILFDYLRLKDGIEYLFWFALGYWFEHERKRSASWDLKRLILTYLMVLVLSLLQSRYHVFPSLYVTMLGCVRIVLMAAIFMRLFPDVLSTKIGKLINRNLFNIYLLHDPLEYVILKIFYTDGLLATGIGSVLYLLARLILVVIIPIGIGEGFRGICKLGKRSH